MYNQSGNSWDGNVDSTLQAVDVSNRVWAEGIRSLFKGRGTAREDTVVKCYIEPQAQCTSERTRPTDRKAVNPLMLRGLNLS